MCVCVRDQQRIAREHEHLCQERDLVHQEALALNTREQQLQQLQSVFLSSSSATPSISSSVLATPGPPQVWFFEAMVLFFLLLFFCFSFFVFSLPHVKAAVTGLDAHSIREES